MTNLDRLRQWAATGIPDDPNYSAGNETFAADVMALLKERDELREALDLIADTGMDARQCMMIARATRSST